METQTQTYKLRSRFAFITDAQCKKSAKEVYPLLVELLEKYTIEYLAVVDEPHALDGMHTHTVYRVSKQPSIAKSTLEELFGKWVHIKPTRDHYKALSYINKLNDPIVYGGKTMDDLLAMTSPKVNVTTTIAKSLLENPHADIMTEHPGFYLMNSKKVKEFKREVIEKKRKLDEVEEKHDWYYGPSGSGKSRTVRALYPGFYDKEVDTNWWGGYDEQEVVLLDDLDKYHVKMSYHFKRWLDRYPFPAAIKGVDKVQIRPKKVIITSQYLPEEIWDDPATVAAIKRRVNIIRFPNKLLK